MEVKPTYFPSVPRIFEKIYTAATANVEKEGGIKKVIFNWAVGVGKKVRERERAGKPIGALLKRQYKFADEKVLSKIRALFGGNLKLAVTGAAPINPEILRFFDAAGRARGRGLGHDRDLDRRDDLAARGVQVRHGRRAPSRAARSRSPTTARSWSRARTSSRATTRTRRRPRRRSSTAGCTPATSASSTRTAT